MKAKRKTFTLTVNYGSRVELIETLKQVSRQVRNSRIRYNRESENTALYEWFIELSMEDRMDYREEFINGKWCRVYQSKMNYEK